MKERIPRAATFSRRQALRSAFIVSLMINLSLLLGIFYGRAHNFVAEISSAWAGYLTFFLWHFCSNVLLFYILFIYNFYVIKRVRRKRKAALMIIGGTLIICCIASPVLSRIQWFIQNMEPGYELNNFIIFNYIKDFIASLIILVLTSNIYLNAKREQAVMAYQKLKEENIRTRFEALKNQLDPHFLFNSLNTLNGLIGIDDEKAHDYLDDLSSVFRYTLHSKTIVRLSDEVEFVEAYISMLKIRYGENMIVKYAVDPQYLDYYIMPASLQLLVENAVKHNTISNKSPLSIHIETTDHDSIIVSNMINPKAEKSGSGVGLANLTDRYAILFGRDINITGSEGVFSVEVPLIKELNKMIKI